MAAATSIVEVAGLKADEAIVVQNSNNLALRLRPCDVFARVAHAGREVARFEVELAQRLAEAEAPSAALDPRCAPRVHERDGFVVTLWTYYDQLGGAVPPVDYASALLRLHAGMRRVGITAPHYTDRVAEAERLVASREASPALAEADREHLGNALRSLRRAVGGRRAAEQLLHGEPYPGNVLRTENGPVFIDLETC
ncbi:MAG: phosphotransferase, partial [Mycobacteriales bacterium]